MKELLNGYSGSYLTRFSCKPVDGNKEGKEVLMNDYVCFSAGGGGFSYYKGKQEFEIIIYKGLDKTITDRKNHLCIFSIGQVIDHIEALNLLFDDSEFKLLELIENKEQYTLKFIIDSSRKIVFAFILTWIRYLWERPYVYATIESFHLKEIYPELDPFSRFTIARASIPSFFCWGTGHSAVKLVDRYYTIEELKSRLHSDDHSNLNGLYDSKGEKLEELPQTINDYSCDSDLEYWTDPNIFEKRIEIYKKIKKYYDEKKA